jgi:hypothetical protein
LIILVKFFARLFALPFNGHRIRFLTICSKWGDQDWPNHDSSHGDNGTLRAFGSAIRLLFGS